MPPSPPPLSHSLFLITGVGTIKYPIMSDLTHKVSKAYGVYDEEAGHTLR